MPVIKVLDVAYSRIRSPDLDAQEEFLVNFGFVRSARTADALYMRGTDSEHHIHVTHLGEPGFIGLAYLAASEEDLEKISKVEGASEVEDIDEPGGGKRVRLIEPNGYQIEVVHGIERPEPLPLHCSPLNCGASGYQRLGELTRLSKGPSQVKRLGHAVIATPDVNGTINWFREMFGFVSSDDVYAGPEDNTIATFNRIDGGEEYSDHHVFLAVHNEQAGLNHMAYEVQDFDDVVMGNEHLMSLDKYEHLWGVGRHGLGSQVFDYWNDPWGRVHEHWTDGDQLNKDHKPGKYPVETGMDSQWGPPPPPSLIHHVTP